MTSTIPKVSVIIPAYNTELYIARAIESVISQTLDNIEILVVDDASTDNTLEIVKSFSDARIKIINSGDKVNKGAANARNKGIEFASGEWIALLDSDDWYKSSRLEALLNFSQEFPEFDIIADDISFSSNNQYINTKTLLAARGDLTGLKSKFIEIDPIYLLKDNFRQDDLHIVAIKPLIKKRFLSENNISYDSSIRMAHDYFFYLHCLVAGGRLAILPESYYVYRLSREGALTTKIAERLECCREGTLLYIDRAKKLDASEELGFLLNKSLIHFEKEISYHSVSNKIKSGGYSQALLELVEDPSLFARFCQKLPKIIKYRLGRK